MKRGKLLRYGFWGLMIVLAILLIRSCGGGDDDNSSSTSTSPEIVTQEELSDTASSEGRTIYWAGEQPGTELELSQPSDERTMVRYLTGGAEAGDPEVDFLTVGTYAFPDAAAALKKLTEQPTAVSATAPGGGVVYFDRTSPQNVYLAFPGQDIEIEVYDPDPARALGLVTSGLIVPVD